MKKLGFYFLFSLIGFASFAQKPNCDINNNFTQNAQFFFNSFQEGTVVYDNNLKTNTLLNYNVVSNNIYYIDDDKIYILSPESVRSVSICDKKFYFHVNKVFELVYNKNIQILTGREVRWEEFQDREGAYGAKSPNTVGTKLNNIDIANMDEDNSFLVNLRDKEEEEFTPRLYYKIKYGNNFYPSNKRGFFKIYSDNKAAIKQYVKENNIDFDKKEDLIELANYCEEF